MLRSSWKSGWRTHRCDCADLQISTDLPWTCPKESVGLAGKTGVYAVLCMLSPVPIHIVSGVTKEANNAHVQFGCQHRQKK